MDVLRWRTHANCWDLFCNKVYTGFHIECAEDGQYHVNPRARQASKRRGPFADLNTAKREAKKLFKEAR